MVCLINGKRVKVGFLFFLGGGVHKKMISCAFSSQKRAKYLYNKQKKLYRTLFCLNQENFKLKKNQQKKHPLKKKTPQIKGDKKLH